MCKTITVESKTFFEVIEIFLISENQNLFSICSAIDCLLVAVVEDSLKIIIQCNFQDKIFKAIMCLYKRNITSDDIKFINC